MLSTNLPTPHSGFMFHAHNLKAKHENEMSEKGSVTKSPTIKQLG
jgi:hypothetical protein